MGALWRKGGCVGVGCYWFGGSRELLHLGLQVFDSLNERCHNVGSFGALGEQGFDSVGGNVLQAGGVFGGFVGRALFSEPFD